MDVTFSCPGCEQRVVTEAGAVPVETTCPTCQGAITVPAVPKPALVKAVPSTVKKKSEPTPAGCKGGFFGCLGLVMIFVLLMIFGSRTPPDPKFASSGYKMGIVDGSVVGANEARLRHAKAGSLAQQGMAERAGATISPFQRKEYVEVWSIGYSVSYDTYGK